MNIHYAYLAIVVPVAIAIQQLLAATLYALFYVALGFLRTPSDGAMRAGWFTDYMAEYYVWTVLNLGTSVTHVDIAANLMSFIAVVWIAAFGYWVVFSK